VESVISFCVARGGPYDERLMRRLMLELTSDPTGVIVIGDGDGLRLVATVVDRISNGADAASLEMFGVRSPLAATEFTRLVIEPAIAFARAGTHRALQVLLPQSVIPADGAEQALRDAGFAYAYDMYEMRRDGSTAAPGTPEPLPAGWVWVPLDVGRADAAHAALVEMFRDAPSANMVSRDDFRRAVASGTTVWRALIERDDVIGLVQIALLGAHGDLRIVGRAPRYRGQGVGPRLVAEGLRMLREGGAGDIALSVEADNDRALDLYRRFGFEVVSRTRAFMRPLR
jgi:ribosomal protein S18 acetylase RimI-like enzyme